MNVAPRPADRCFLHHARLAAAVLLVTGLFPCDAEAGRVLFPWQVISDLHLANAAATLAPCLVGASVLVASFVCQGTLSFALVTLAAMFAPSVIVWSSAPWQDESCMANFAERSLPVGLVVALVAASLHTPPGPGATRVRRTAAS